MNSMMTYLIGFGLTAMVVWVAWEFAYDAWKHRKQSTEPKPVNSEQSDDTQRSQEDDNPGPPLAAA